MKPIDLSESNSPMTEMMLKSEGEHYPSVTFRETADYKLPDSGEITFSFEKKRYVEEIYDGKKTYSCTLSLHAITDVSDKEVKPPARNTSKDSGESLDAIRAEKMKDDESEDY